jgi:hypothetical protein
MYEQLLKFESLELSRKPSISWERIMQIRHLKDRMVRKCHRLSRTSSSKKPSKGEPLTFQTVLAPADFRVREMEKWFREQQRRTGMIAARSEPVRAISMNERSYVSALTPSEEFGQLPSSGRYRSLPSSSRKPLPITQAWSDSRVKPIPPPTTPTVRSELSHQLGPSQSYPPAQSEMAAQHRQPAAPFSPPALPILLRSQRCALEDEFQQQASGVGLSTFSNMAVRGSNPPDSSSEDSATAPQPDGATGEHVVRRRRSCIKRASIGEITKSVSWADEPDWESRISRYTNAAKDAQRSGRKWEEIREIYLEQMSSLDSLQDQVSQGLANLLIESEHLERVEKTISQQREALRATFQDLEQKQSLFQSKVQEVLQEADHVLSIAGIKKDG